MGGWATVALAVMMLPRSICAGQSAHWAHWKVNETWSMRVEFEDFTCNVHAFPSDLEPFQHVACWQLTFLPGDQAPKFLKSRHRVLVDINTGHTVRAYTMPGRKEIPVLRAGEFTFITGAPEGMPIELVSCLDWPDLKLVEIDDKRHFVFRKHASGEMILVDLALYQEESEQLRIKQTWVPGEKWWREYERHVKGKKDLTAKLLNPPPLKADLARQQKLLDDWKRFYDLHPLGADRNLHVRINLIDKNPKLRPILNEIQSATKVQLTVADNLARHDPDFGEIIWKNAIAYACLDLIAAQDLDNGRWQKTETGYRLEGISKRLRPLPPGFPWTWTAVGLASAAAVAAASWIIMRRRSGRKAAA